MKISKRDCKTFFFEGSKKIGCLLIHGFTGSPSEMRLLGEFLHKEGYTVYTPLLSGHGISPDEMKKTNKDNWFKSVVDGYDYLKVEGCENIVAIGLSMGGTLSLKLANERELLGIVSLAAPIFVQNKLMRFSKWIKYFIPYQEKTKKAEHIQKHLSVYDRTPIACAESLNLLIKEVKANLKKISVPALIIQGKADETVRYESAEYIYKNIRSTKKQIKWYDQSTHIITLDRDRDKVFQDINLFLKQISK